MNEEFDTTYTVPTFPTSHVDQEVEISVDSLNDPASANALRVADPFTYYSCFTPSNTLSCKLTDLLSIAQQSCEEEPNQTMTIKVARRRRVSAESDGLEFLLNGTQDSSSDVQSHINIQDANHVQGYCDEYDAFLFQLLSSLGANTENDSQEEVEEEYLNMTLHKE